LPGPPLLLNLAVILSAAKDLLGGPNAWRTDNILRCAQDYRLLVTSKHGYA
jgi:hypothetical protein